jgi:hypothetical protein
MIRKEKSLSKYPEWNKYKNQSGMLLPKMSAMMSGVPERVPVVTPTKGN